MDKIQELKQVVGDEVADEILSTSKTLTTRAERLGLKYKENKMADFAEFMAAYQAFKAYTAGDAGTADVEDDDAVDPVVEPVTEAVAVKMDDGAIERAVMKAVKAAFAEMKAMDGKMEDKKADKELSSLKAENAELLTAVKALTDRVAALEQPIAPTMNGGYRMTATSNPQEVGKELRGMMSWIKK
jgi:hypothetical protein